MNLFLGRNRENGRPVHLAPQARTAHLLMLGASRSGKTTLMESMIRQDIDAGHGVIVLDPHGTLYYNLLEYCYVNKRHQKRLYLIDPNEDDRRFGINYFDLPGMDGDARVRLVLDGLYKAFGQTPAEAKVLLERWGKAALRTLESADLTLADLYYFLVDSDFREAVLSQNENAFVQHEWDHFNKKAQREQDWHSLAILDRAVKFAESARTSQIFGQDNTIDWPRVMDEGGIVLVNLLPTRAPEDLTKVVGISLLHLIFANAKQREKNNPRTKHVYVYVDEFSQLMTEDYAKALRELAGFGVHFLLSQQDINDLRRADENEILFNTVINNSDVKVVFRLGNYNEASEMAKHLFATQITGDEIKHETTSAIPEAYQENVRIHTESSAAGDSKQEILSADGVELREGTGTSSLSGHSMTETTAQRVDYSYEKIPVFRSVEESLHNFSSAIMSQAVGEAFVLFNPKLPARPIRTIVPPSYNTRSEYIDKTKQEIHDRMGLRTPAEAQEMIDERRRSFFKTKKPTKRPRRNTGDEP